MAELEPWALIPAAFIVVLVTITLIWLAYLAGPSDEPMGEP